MFKDNSSNKQRRHTNKTFRDEISGVHPMSSASAESISHECLICERTLDSIEDRAKIQIVPDWANATICKACRRKNRGGILLEKHLRLNMYLANNNIKPALTDAGLIKMPAKFIGIEE